jgi:hypothetical protein
MREVASIGVLDSIDFNPTVIEADSKEVEDSILRGVGAEVVDIKNDFIAILVIKD